MEYLSILEYLSASFPYVLVVVVVSRLLLAFYGIPPRFGPVSSSFERVGLSILLRTSFRSAFMSFNAI